jgi:hypothetical protein
MAAFLIMFSAALVISALGLIAVFVSADVEVDENGQQGLDGDLSSSH